MDPHDKLSPAVGHSILKAVGDLMKKQKAAPKSSWWSFSGQDETFTAQNPDRVSRLYFPLCNEAGLLSAITPTLHGDIKTGQNTFVTMPVSEQDLHNTRSARNFWVYIEGKGAWSAAGSSADAISSRAGGKRAETVTLDAGALWHRITRENKTLGLRATLTSFIPAAAEQVEILQVELENISRKPMAITATSAIPLFGRSADNLRDHRHVTSLLHRIDQENAGVLVTPTMSFDERGHHPNSLVYAVLGCDGDGQLPTGSFPTVDSFIGEGGTYDAPRAVLEDLDPADLSDTQRQGREAIGALRFKSRKLAPGKKITYLLFTGIAKDRKEALSWIKTYGTTEKTTESLAHTQAFWKERIDRFQIETGDADFGKWVRWITVQPMLRKIFGCSFLPDHDYGRGGRGWRDLWQDCLALLLLDSGTGGDASGTVRTMLLNNFGGVRENGSNATIIGKAPGEFIADRNNISRTWMDHGAWPWMTTELYMNQTGDLKFLLEEVPYFQGGKGTVLEHVIVQHLAAAADLGAHGNCRLQDADWNDGLDMAHDKGESVAFTALYAGNLIRIAETLGVLKKKLGLQTVAYKGNKQKNIDELAQELREKGEALSAHVREKEWIQCEAGYSWFNGYYDNNSKRVEGDHPKGVRMTLTGQVFPIMAGVATNEQVQQSYAAARKYLKDRKFGGYRLNTDFGEIQLQLGRAFSFAYGEKENGAFFSHMTVMFANALYQRGFVEEGHDVLSSIYRMCRDADTGRIYPGIPEYFNGEGRGLYHYLTGSASWYLLTIVTQVLGIRGQWGDLVLAPKLMPEEFAGKGQITAQTGFAGKSLKVTYVNPSKKPYSQYKIQSVLLQGRVFPTTGGQDVVIPRENIQNLAGNTVEITVSLG